MSKKRDVKSAFGPLLADSQITEVERRQVRCREREILQELKEKSAEASQLTSTVFQDKAAELDTIYTKVVYPREANLDACNLDEFSNLVVKQAGLMSASDLTKFDVGDLINAAKEKCAADESESVFDWDRLGSAVGACFQSTAGANFMYGSMNTQLVTKERRASRRRRAEDLDEEETQPTQVTKGSLVQEDVQAGRLKVLENIVREQGKYSLFDMCLNPTSFAQTIENLFDTSFLIRDGKAQVELDRNGLPQVGMSRLPPLLPNEPMHVVNKAGITGDVPVPTQCIISLTYEDWEKLAPLYGEPLVGNRAAPRV
ncbi:Aste57867_16869 [Aphanomyces stellatus]|uniref:Non-structural maintenance of chromosomes element 4 n=1 Tax=Aphanomyces stellatus TaxID=120398 RepID=A0A485L6F0_9STRA|nr:hypothetical protein As57867_016811 [Aphanomyces stellatus]VFT93632.1 Aste57867_16869 [Aphanomyces stellatus]